MNQETNEHLEVEKSLHKALANDEFVIFYQPQINLHNNKMVGLEALVRWQHPIDGLVLPNHFIPRAEETRLIVPLGLLLTSSLGHPISDWTI
jgi:EAL domain-containing protein (putative c-di-GMP-specific phosphodiesterase class I)